MGIFASPSVSSDGESQSSDSDSELWHAGGLRGRGGGTSLGSDEVSSRSLGRSGGGPSSSSSSDECGGDGGAAAVAALVLALAARWVLRCGIVGVGKLISNGRRSQRCDGGGGGLLWGHGRAEAEVLSLSVLGSHLKLGWLFGGEFCWCLQFVRGFPTVVVWWVLPQTMPGLAVLLEVACGQCGASSSLGVA